MENSKILYHIFFEYPKKMMIIDLINFLVFYQYIKFGNLLIV